tara:strand:- start:128 stop:250 length:123 start_codon:yes stop_codon:yes gene_type:complete
MFHISLLCEGNTKIMPEKPLLLANEDTQCWRGMKKSLQKA